MDEHENDNTDYMIRKRRRRKRNRRKKKRRMEEEEEEQGRRGGEREREGKEKGEKITYIHINNVPVLLCYLIFATILRGGYHYFYF